MSDGPVNAFEELVKRGATPAEVARLKKIKDKLGIDDKDAIWSVFLGLEYYLTLYSAQSDSLERRVYNAVRDALPNERNEISSSSSTSTESNFAALKVGILGLIAGSGAAIGFFVTGYVLSFFG